MVFKENLGFCHFFLNCGTSKVIVCLYYGINNEILGLSKKEKVVIFLISDIFVCQADKESTVLALVNLTQISVSEKRES